MRMTGKQYSVLPGFGLTLGCALLYLSLIVLLPLSGLFFKTATLTWTQFWSTVSSARVLASYQLTFGASLAAAAVNVVFGFVVAWTLVRYDFPGKRLIDALVDLPFALPTAVSGIALTAIYSANGWIGQYLEPLGIKTAFSPLGATRGQTFRRVIMPSILPALVTGGSLAFARALGEYGSVVFISGNMPMKTEITSLLIITKLEQYDYAGATAIAIVMLLASFALLLLINGLQWWSGQRAREVV